MATERIIERSVQDSPAAKGLNAQEYLHTPLVAVLVPLLVAVVTGLMVGMLVGVLAGVISGSVDAVVIGLVWGVVTFLVVTLGVWVLMLWRWFGLTDLERLTGIDINRDGMIGKPKTVAAPGIRITLSKLDDRGHLSETQFIQLPGQPEAIVMLCTSLLGGASFGERVWSGDGKPFSQGDFRVIRKIFVDKGWVEPKSEKDGSGRATQGYQLTADGTRALTEIRDRYASFAPAPLGE